MVHAWNLCHNCDSKPVLGDNTDCIDGLRLLILWNLLKAKKWSMVPAYRLARYFQQFVSVEDSRWTVAPVEVYLCPASASPTTQRGSFVAGSWQSLPESFVTVSGNEAQRILT